MINDKTTNYMANNKFKIIYRTPLVVLRRGKFKTLTLVVKNAGQETWHDPRREDEDTHIVGGLINEQKKRDFNIWWGKRPRGKVDRKFNNTFTKFFTPIWKNQGKLEPKQIALLKLRVEARKFATKGMNNLKFGMFARSAGKETMIQGKGKAIRVLVLPRMLQWSHLWHTLKLSFVNVGKIEAVNTNKAFAERGDFELQIPIVMATWHRIELLPQTIAALEEQIGPTPVLYLWNNNFSEEKKINIAIKNTALPIKVFHSKHNIGGFGRFFAAKELEGVYDKVIFIDDDQFPNKNYVKRVANEFEPGTIKSQWAYRFLDKDNYWHKEFVSPGKDADYCGTGGMVADIGIFKDKRLYKCPKRYWFIEDLWLSYFARYERGWRLTRTSVDLPIFEDGKDQLSSLVDAKTSFYKFLNRKYTAN